MQQIRQHAAMAIDLDELALRQPHATPRDLSGLGIAELQDYITRLQAEIVRAEEMMTQKRAHQDSAQSLFRS